MTLEERYNVAEQIEKVLRDNSIWAEVYPSTLPDIVSVEINWGDWKHDHARAKWLIKEMGYELIGTQLCEENGSDCYSAIHRFKVH